jgi:hypothetical protein
MMKTPLVFSRRFACFWGLALVSLGSGSATLPAADVSQYWVVKQQRYLQSSATPPTAASQDPFQYASRIYGFDINAASVQGPTGSPVVLADEIDYWGATRGFASKSALDAAFGNGTHTLTIDTLNDGTTVAPLQLVGDGYPGAPYIANYSEAQAINPTQDFTLGWLLLPGGAAADYLQVQVIDSIMGFSFTLFETAPYGDSEALGGSVTSVVIPADTLEDNKSYTVLVTAYNVVESNTTAYPDAEGLAAYAAETQFTVRTGSGGTITGPTLVIATPSNGATNVSTLSPLTLVFDKSMATDVAIAWSANVNPANVSHQWMMPNALMISCFGGWPANAQVSYTLNPAGTPAAQAFRDTAGNLLPLTQGNFNTGGGGSTGGCGETETNDTAIGGFSLQKTVSYVQTNANAPVLDGDDAAWFMAIVTSPTNNPVVEATLKLPGGSTLILSNPVVLMPRYFSYNASFSTPAAMDAAFPAGTYTFTVKRTDNATQSASLAVPAGSEPPVPHLANFPELLSFNAGQDFTFRWDPFAGVTSQDMLYIMVSDRNTNFHAPDPCIPRELANTATSILLPKNTLSANTNNSGALMFMRFLAHNTNAIPDILGSASYTKMTGFDFINQGENPEQPSAPQFEPGGVSVSPDGTVELDLSGDPGSTFEIEFSTDLKSWTWIHTETATNGTLRYTHSPPPTATAGFYRAKAVP